MKANIIVAVGNATEKGFPIGKDGKLPWHNKADLKWFKETTFGHPVIMGRKTWESLPNAPLQGRANIVVTRASKNIYSTKEGDEVFSVTSVEEALKLAERISKETPFIIGGASIFNYAIENDLVDTIYMDLLAENVEDADAFFPDVLTNHQWETTGETVEIEKSKAYAITLVKTKGKNNHVDEQYLKLVNEIIEKGEPKDTRAGKTRSLFSRQLRFNLKEGLPMLTTKKMFSKGVIYELLWFIKGGTNIQYLTEHNVHIWDDDAYRYYLELAKGYGKTDVISKEEFLKRVELGRKENWIIEKIPNKDGKYNTYTYGDLNRIYGAQWTNWGGHNQIEEVINTLKINPDDRRMMISAWNVDEISDMALPPCHYCCQFYTRKMTKEERYHLMNTNVPIDEITIEQMDNEGIPSRKLSCVWHQRSVDSLLGLPFNILSYALLTHMIAQCANMDVDELIFDGGDVHIYENQIDIYEAEQKKRNPHRYALPKLALNSSIKNINDFTYDDIKIMGYESYQAIKYPLSVGLK